MTETSLLIKPGSSIAHLTVSLASRSFTLSADDLAKHPDSLLAGLAAEGSSSLNLADVEVLNPLTTWPEALPIIPSLYRCGGFPVDFLEQQLDQLYGTKTDYMAAYDALYAKLQRLLSFLNLPARPVLSWIRWDTCTLKQSKVLRFSSKCLVQPAVDAMLDYTPFRKKSTYSSGGVQGHAAFVVVDEHGIAAPLSVYAVRTARLSIDRELASLAEPPEPRAGASQSIGTLDKMWCGMEIMTYDDLDVTAALLPGIGSKERLSRGDMQNCIPMGHPVFGKQLVHSLTAADDGRAFVLESVVSRYRGQPYSYRAPLLVMRW